MREERMMEMMLSMMIKYRCWVSCLYTYLTSLEVVYGDRQTIPQLSASISTGL
jgi:hypothetical protein